MSKAPDNHELARRQSVLEERVKAISAKLEERMNTQQANHDTSFERLRADIHAERVSSQRWTFALAIAAVTIIIGAIAGFNLYLLADWPPAGP